MQIELLGTSFTIQTDEDPAYLKNVVDNYRAKVQEIQSSVRNADELKVAILSGLLAVDELLKERHRAEVARSSDEQKTDDYPAPVDEAEIERITSSLVASIDEVLAAGDG